MSDKSKNIVTNIIGIIFFAIAIFYALKDAKDYTTYIVLLVVACVLFLYKITETKKWIDKFLNKFLSNGENR